MAPDTPRFPLLGQRIVVTRAREQAGELAARLAALGAETIELPVIEFLPPADSAPLDAAIARLSTYDWLIFTSANGVSRFIERLDASGADLRSLRARIAAIGPATRAAVERLHLKVDVTPPEYVAEGLIAALGGEDLKGKRILLPRAAVARDVLPEELARRGATVDVVEAYRTAIPADAAARAREVFSDPRRPDWITFTSTSTVTNFLEAACAEALAGVRVASIGPVTSAAARRRGLDVAVEAVEYTTEGLVSAIVEASPPAAAPGEAPPQELTERLRSFWASRALLTAVDLDLFEAVGEGGTADEIAGRMGTDPRATEMLLHATVALGALEKAGGAFRNTADSARWFRGHGRLALMHMVNLWTRWSSLTECIRTGAPAPAPPREERPPDWTRSFIAAMHQNASSFAGAVVQAVGAVEVKRMLDVGGGSGAYSIAFARANPELRSEILDLPAVTPLARSYIQEAGLSGRITLREGDLHQPEYGQGYDLVFISAICHMLAPEENLAMLRKAHAALAPGGRVVLQDFILERDKTAPLQAALFSLNMLVGTERGSSYSEDEYAAWLRDAGFEGVRRVRLPGPAGLMIGVRPL